jgi:hypothetical protein
MKIAVIGAPGAGKSEFAHDLARTLFKEQGERYRVVDDYVPELRQTTHLEYGGFGDYISDLQVVFKRREWELAWPDFHTITVGSVLDSTAHCFARVEDTVHNSRELVLASERLRTIAETFGLVYVDTWEYDYAFYLPYTGDDHYSRLVNQALVELLRTYSPIVFSFKSEVPDDQKASTAARTILALEAEQLPPTEQRGVRPGGADGEADGDSSEPVPDVPEQGTNPDDA